MTVEKIMTYVLNLKKGVVQISVVQMILNAPNAQNEVASIDFFLKKPINVQLTDNLNHPELSELVMTYGIYIYSRTCQHQKK